MMSAPDPPRQPDTWTSYPDLLQEIDGEDVKRSIERAVCASTCGRYDEASAIFERELPSPERSPWLALDWADMLTMQGCEPQRVELLERCLSEPFDILPEHSDLEVLLRLMHADATFWTTGDRHVLLNSLANIREYMKQRDCNNLSDVEARIVTLYYSATRQMLDFCNEIPNSDRTIFSRFNGERAAEMHHLRERFLSTQRYRFGITFLQLELAHAVAEQEKSAIQQAAQELIGTLASQTSEPIRYRSAMLTKVLGDFMGSMKLLWNIIPAGVDWKDYFPIMAFDLDLLTANRPDRSFDDRIEQLNTLIQRALHRHDYTKANQAFIPKVALLGKQLEDKRNTVEQSDSLAALFTGQREYLAFHKEQTRMPYFESVALGDHLTSVFRFQRDRSPYLALYSLQEFFEMHPRYSIPVGQERLYWIGHRAAFALGRTSTSQEMQQKYMSAKSKAKFSDSSGGQDLSEAALQDADYAERQLSNDGLDPVQVGNNALKLMLHWATFEIKDELLTETQGQTLFGLTLVPPKTLREQLDTANFENLCDKIFGPVNKPTDSTTFLLRYKDLKDWIFTPERGPSKLARISALKHFLNGRVRRARQYMMDMGTLNPTEEQMSEQMSSYTVDVDQLDDLTRLEAAEKGSSASADEALVVSRIQVILARSFMQYTAASTSITDAALAGAADDCQRLIKVQHDSGNSLREYQYLCMLLRLNWQRQAKFSSRSVRDILGVADRADEAFERIRNSVGSSATSDDFVARSKLSDDFQGREHFNIAMAALYQDYRGSRDNGSQEQAQSSLSSLVTWSTKSKGSSLMDMLQLKGQPKQQNLPVISSAQLEQNLASLNLLPDLKTPSQKSQIQDMLDGMASSAVIIDFVSIPYVTQSQLLVAFVYRKDRACRLVEISSVSMSDIVEWSQQRLANDAASLREKDLGMAALEKLARLILPFLTSTPEPLLSRDETVVICPTGPLTGIPIHAIPVEGDIFLKRNPVVYCQSLPLLFQAWQACRGANNSREDSLISTVINPLPSEHSVATLAEAISASRYIHGFEEITQEATIEALNGASLLHYHGHVFHDPSSAMDSALLLNRNAYKTAGKKIKRWQGPAPQTLSARDIIDKVELRQPALANVIGCSSGVGHVTSTDDVLGIPTALQFKGATAVVNTLWKISERNGANFANSFYEAMRRNTSNASVQEASADQAVHFINLARLMQTAVLQLYEEPGTTTKRPPWDWAAFNLLGCWLFPSDQLPR